MIDMIKDYVALVAIVIAEGEVDLKVLLEDQKDRFLRHSQFEMVVVTDAKMGHRTGRLKAEVAIVVIATNFVCAIRRSWEYCCHRRYHQLRD